MNGRLIKDKVQSIGLKIDASLNGVLKREYERQPGIDLATVWDRMLDAWVTGVEITDMGGAEILKDALLECGERALASNIQLLT